MSAPSIPNLLSLRGASRGGGRGRGFGRGRGGVGSSSSSPTPGHDITIQGTDTDAALSRLSAVELGYLDDPFAEFLAQNTAPGPPTRRLPIINRGNPHPCQHTHTQPKPKPKPKHPINRPPGTYTRTTAIDTIVNHFLASTSGSPRQIVSLGAGTDTRALRLFTTTPPTPHTDILYHEIDFPAISAKKLATVRTAPRLRPVLTITDTFPTFWAAHSASEPSNQLRCHGVDLRVLASPSRKPQQEPQAPEPGSESGPPSSELIQGLRHDIPTLLISECCLCYLSPEQASAVLSHFTQRIHDLGIVLYEPVRPDDPFGRMMVTNLAARRIHMPTLEVYKLPSDQAQRLVDAGFEKVEQMTVDRIWERWVSPDEKERVDSLEGLDEVEEWLLLAGHYIVAWGWRADKFTLPET